MLVPWLEPLPVVRLQSTLDARGTYDCCNPKYNWMVMHIFCQRFIIFVHGKVVSWIWCWYNLICVTLGILLAYVLGLFVNWRVLAVLGILPCTILIPGLFFIPESPRWLAKMGMTEDFEASLQVLRGFDTDISTVVNEIKL